MFHFETSFCVMGDSWWPRNTLQFFSRASLRMKPLANLVLFFFWISSLALLAHFGRWKIHSRVIYQLFQWDFTNPHIFFGFFPTKSPRCSFRYFKASHLHLQDGCWLLQGIGRSWCIWVVSLRMPCSEWPNVPHLGILGSAETKNPCFGWRAFRKRQYFPRERMFFPSAMLQSLTCELISAIFGYLLWVSYQFWVDLCGHFSYF